MIESAESAGYLFLLGPIVIIIIALLVGLFIEYIVLTWLHGLAANTEWGLDDIFIQSLRGLPILWALLLGAYFVIPLIASGLTSLYISYSRQGLIIVAIISAMVVIMRITTQWINLSSGAGNFPAVSVLTNFLRVIIASITIMIILQYAGISITPALAALGVSGLAVSLALQEPLSSLFSGILIVASNQLKPGQYVRLSSGEEGYIIDINWRTTNIRQLANNMVIVPNSQMTSAIVINYDTPEKELSILFDVGVSYDSDLEHVEQVTIEVASEVMQEVTGGVPGTTPFIRYNQFQDFSINFTVIMRGAEFVDQYLIKHEFVKRLHRRYRQEGIVIPFPIQTLHTPGASHMEVMYMQEQNNHQSSARARISEPVDGDRDSST
jgi:small-conductance mechanosensitive channel